MSTRAFFWSLLVAAGLVALAAPVATQDADTSQPWLHVQITSDGHEHRDGHHDDDGHGDGDRRDDDDRHHDDGDDGHDDDDDDGDGPFDVNINVPLSAAEPLFSLLTRNILSDGQLAVAGHDVPISTLRDLWRAIESVGDTEFLTLEGEDETARVARAGDEIHVQVEETCGEEAAETVDIRIPVVVLDALFSGDSDTLNIAAAFERLGELRGDIVRVTGDDHVRVWIDEVAHPSE